MSASRGSGCLLVADISGYTSYVVASPLEHAEDVVADVTRAVVAQLEAVIRVNKLEGDAVFGYALDEEIDATMLLDVLDECYFAFRGRLRGIEHSVSCACGACSGVADLDLKFVVHHGTFVRRAGARGEELTGHDVIVVHRLLKNGVAERLGTHAYTFLTEACATAFELDPAALGLERQVERYPDVGEIVGYAGDLEARWRLERERRRVRVEEGEAAFSVAVVVPVRAEAAWQLLTAPQKRLLWQVDAVEQADPGGRRSTGSAGVCVDGRTKIYEEILDWRPFDYFTERISLSGGLGAVLTTVLEPGDGGTRVVTRVRRDTGPRLAWPTAGRRLRRRLGARYARLAALAATEISEERRLPLAAS